MNIGDYRLDFYLERERDFPDEHLGVADKFLLYLCVRKAAEEDRLRKLMEVKNEMKKYGFNPKKDHEDYM